MADFEVATDAEQLLGRLDAVATGIETASRKALLRTGLVLDRHIIVEHLTGGTTAKKLAVRSARLRRSIGKRVRNEREGPVLEVGTDVVYGRTHEFGKTIRPVRTKYLTIPLDASKFPTGVARWTAREIIDNPGAGGYTGTFFRTSKAGNLILFGKERSGRIRPLFVLKRSTRIPPRPFLSSSLEETTDRIENIFGEEIGRVIR